MYNNIDSKLNGAGDMAKVFNIANERAEELHDKFADFSSAYTKEITPFYIQGEDYPIQDFPKRFIENADPQTDMEFGYICTFIGPVADAIKALLSNDTEKILNILLS